MIITLLSAVLTALSPVSQNKVSSDNGYSVRSTINFQGNFPYYSGNFYETYFEFNNFRDNNYGYEYYDDINITIDDTPYLLYRIEFENNNADGTVGRQYYINVEMTHACMYALQSSNFTCFLLITFESSGNIVHQLASRIYDQSDFAFDYNDRYFVGLYDVSDRGFTGTPINSQYSGEWYNAGAVYDRVYFAIEWQYKERFTNADGSYNDGYNTGYRDGYNDGESVSIDTAYNNGYTQGSLVGYNNGYELGQVNGYNNGYQAGLQESGGDYSFRGLFRAIVDTPIWFLNSLFNFDFFGTGTTFITMITSLLTALVIVTLIKKVF